METLIDQEILTFRLGDKRFGIKLSNVREIVRLPRVTRLPLAPAFVLGVINLRGAVITVLSGLLRLGRAAVPNTDRSRILILQIRDVVLGLLVDAVDHIVSFSSEQLTAAPASESEEIGDLLSGIVRRDGNTILRLDAAKLLNGELQRPGVTLQGGLPAPPASDSDSPGAKVATVRLRRIVIVKIGREEFGLPAERVREVIRFEEPNPIPDSPEFLLGVVTLRDSVLAIVDLRSLMRRASLQQETARAFGLIAADYKQAAEMIDRAKVCAACLENVRRHLALMPCDTPETKRLRAANELLAEQLRSTRAPTRNDVQLRIGGLSALALAMSNAAGTASRRVVIVQAEGSRFGLAVDAVTEILDVPESILQPPPPIANESGVQLDAVAQIEGGKRLVLLLRLDEIIRKNRLDLVKGMVESNETVDAVRPMHSSREQWVVFEVAEEEYGLPIGEVEEIGRLQAVTRLPVARKFLQGVVNVRGEVVPVIDLRKRFGLALATATQRSRVVYFRAGKTKYGLIVDCVSQIVSVSASDIAPLPAGTCSEHVEEYLKGFAKVEDRMVMLLNAQCLLTKAEQESAQKATEQVREPSPRPPKTPRKKRQV